MEYLPLESDSADVVISNCAINLALDKQSVLKEAFRVLKPGGVLAISDLVVSGVLPQSIKNDPQAWAACIAGAVTEEEYLRQISAAGFVDIGARRRAPIALDGISGSLDRWNPAREASQSSFEILSLAIVATKPRPNPG